MLVIHPGECIDCGACEPECPVDAIYPDGALPQQWSAFAAVTEAAGVNLGQANDLANAYATEHSIGNAGSSDPSS